MKVMVLGKEHMSGTSKKTGKAYDANVVHVSYKRSGVEGQTVESVWLDPSFIALAHIDIGKEYNLDRDGRGYVVGFDQVPAAR